MADKIHVLPVNDLRPHDLSADCWCNPTVDAGEPDVLIHNSADGREHIEAIRRLH